LQATVVRPVVIRYVRYDEKIKAPTTQMLQLRIGACTRQALELDSSVVEGIRNRKRDISSADWPEHLLHFNCYRFPAILFLSQLLFVAPHFSYLCLFDLG